MDGLGWLVEKRALIMATFGWSSRYVRNHLPGAEGWVWYNWALEHKANVMGGRLNRSTPGYVGQEREAILKRWQAKAKSA